MAVRVDGLAQKTVRLWVDPELLAVHDMALEDLVLEQRYDVLCELPGDAWQ